MKLSEIKLNPANPRLIRDDKFTKLVQSIKDFPAMMELCPIVVNSEMMILGGNMRYRACQELGMKEVPDEWVKVADKLTEDEQRRFTVEDNVSFGDWDWDVLKEWDNEKLQEWGVDVPGFMILPLDNELIGENKGKPVTMKITFPTPEDLQNCESDIQEVINRICPKAFYSVSAGEI